MFSIAKENIHQHFYVKKYLINELMSLMEITFLVKNILNLIIRFRWKWTRLARRLPIQKSIRRRRQQQAAERIHSPGFCKVPRRRIRPAAGCPASCTRDGQETTRTAYVRYYPYNKVTGCLFVCLRVCLY